MALAAAYLFYIAMVLAVGLLLITPDRIASPLLRGALAAVAVALFLLPLVWANRVLHALILRPWLERNMPRRCADCGYDLTGNITGICPECGVEATREARGGR